MKGCRGMLHRILITMSSALQREYDRQLAEFKRLGRFRIAAPDPHLEARAEHYAANAPPSPGENQSSANATSDEDTPEFTYEQLLDIVDMMVQQCAQKAGRPSEDFCNVASAVKQALPSGMRDCSEMLHSRSQVRKLLAFTVEMCNQFVNSTQSHCSQ